jgi:hypothetical protein
MVKTSIFLLAFSLAGCSSGMYEMLSRSFDDPVVIKPHVESFLESNTIFISWDYDEAADEYILERAKDHPISLVYHVIYRGKDIEYADRDLQNDALYIYRLSKRRGLRTFGPSGEVLGASSLITRDIYRNDTKEKALRLEANDFILNIFYYRSYTGMELIDEDWFYIDIPPMRQASVVINDSQVSEGDFPTHFEYYEYAVKSDTVRQLRDFWIINTELTTRRCYFKIFPTRSQFVADGIPAGGKFVSYTISLRSIVPYN